MTPDQQAAQDMRREVKNQCLWCGESMAVQHPVVWDPVYTTPGWPVGMCGACYNAGRAG